MRGKRAAYAVSPDVKGRSRIKHMNYKCPKCGTAISLYWLLTKFIDENYQCKKCLDYIQSTSRYNLVGRIAAGISGGGGVLIFLR